MWELTIYQKHDLGTYDTEHNVRFVSEDLQEMFGIIDKLTHTNEVEETRYEIRKIDEENWIPTTIINRGER